MRALVSSLMLVPSFSAGRDREQSSSACFTWTRVARISTAGPLVLNVSVLFSAYGLGRFVGGFRCSDFGVDLFVCFPFRMETTTST